MLKEQKNVGRGGKSQSFCVAPMHMSPCTTHTLSPPSRLSAHYFVCSNSTHPSDGEEGKLTGCVSGEEQNSHGIPQIPVICMYSACTQGKLRLPLGAAKAGSKWTVPYHEGFLRHEKFPSEFSAPNLVHMPSRC